MSRPIRITDTKITASALVTIGDWTYYNDGFMRSKPFHEGLFLNGFYTEQQMTLLDTLMVIKELKRKINNA